MESSKARWIGLSVIALACVLYSMDLTVLNLAIPAISADLQPSSTQLLWIVDIYGFMVAGALITMGTLGDRIGRRRLLMIGAAAFGVASVLAAFSNSAEMLIVTRALHGLAGATIAPSTLSLIRNMFDDPAERMKAILERRSEGLSPADLLFKGVSADHMSEMAMRHGAPRFMLHDLRKMVATVGQKLGLGDAVLRRILNHTAPKTDVLNRHYVGLTGDDVREGLERIQNELDALMRR